MDGKNDWAALAARKAIVLHIPTQVIGCVVQFYDGDATIYKTPATNADVKGKVIVFESGHSFVAKAENFIVLEQHEAEFYAGCQKVLTEGLKALIRLGAEKGVMPATLNVLIIASLRTQAMVLETGHRRAFGGRGDEAVG